MVAAEEIVRSLLEKPFSDLGWQLFYFFNFKISCFLTELIKNSTCFRFRNGITYKNTRTHTGRVITLTLNQPSA